MKTEVYLLDVEQWLDAGAEDSVTRESEEVLGKELHKGEKGLLLTDPTAKQALACLCKARTEKVLRARTVSGQALSLGAGLLLQYVWENYVPDNQRDEVGQIMPRSQKLRNLTTADLLKTLKETEITDIPLTYGSEGKPYITEGTFYFSLSHSGHYVLCAVSDGEVGADIQEQKTPVQEKLAKRVLTAEEYGHFSVLSDEDRVAYFYEKWAEKEAYGKLTGEGVFRQLESGDKGKVDCIYRSFHWENYSICVCCYKESC